MPPSHAYSALLLFSLLISCDALKRKAWVIGIDGLRADVLEYLMSNHTLPNIGSIAREGRRAECASVRSTTCARAHTTPISNSDYHWSTAPGWASVVTGVDTQKLHVKGNDLQSMLGFKASVAKHPTMFFKAHQSGLTTAATGCPNFLSGCLEWCQSVLTGA